MAKKPQQKNTFQPNTTIKQKRKKYIKSNLLFLGISSFILYFSVNIFMTYSGKFRSFSTERLLEWIKNFPITETIFAPPQGMTLLILTLYIAIVIIFATKGYTRITDDITKEHGTAQWGSIKDFNERYSLSTNLPAPDNSRPNFRFSFLRRNKR